MSHLSPPFSSPVLCGHCDHGHEPAPDGKNPPTCSRCGEKLKWNATINISSCLALALAGLIFCVLANLYPIVTFDVHGAKQSNLLITGVIGLHYQNYTLVAALVLLCSMIAPFFRLLGLGYVLSACQAGWNAPGLREAFLLAGKMKPWSLIEVYAVALVVASARLDLLGEVECKIGALFVVLLFVFCLALDQILDEEALWEEVRKLRGAGAARTTGARKPASWTACPCCRNAVPFWDDETEKECPRCEVRMEYRRAGSLQKAWALAVAGLIFIIPANVLYVMNISITGDLQQLTIWGGVEELYGVGLAPVAVIVFFASLMVPILKLAGLIWILLTHDQAGGRHLRARVYHYIHVFGRWSMVDIFLLSVLVAVGQLGVLASVDTKPGALYFCLVFLCTIFAVSSFDARLIWDGVPETEAAPEPRKA